MNVHINVDNSNELLARMAMVTDVGPFHLVIACRPFLMHWKVAVSLCAQFYNEFRNTWFLEVLNNISTTLTPSGVTGNQLFDSLCMISRPCIYLPD